MREALGLVETRGLSNAISVADAMSKTANINIIGLENSKGLGYMTIKVTGDVGAVNAAVTCGKQVALENNSFVTAKVIPRPSSNIEAAFCQLNNKNENIPKENNLNEKDEDKENVIASRDTVIETVVKIENDSLTDVTGAEESIEEETSRKVIEEGKEDEVLVKEEENKEESENPSGPKEIPSTTEKSKTKRNSRKKVDTKKKDE